MNEYSGFGDYRPADVRRGAGTELAFLLIGAAAGALTALLLAPHTGQQTRRILRRRYEDAVDGISERADAWRERADAWRERGAAFGGRKSIPFRRQRQLIVSQQQNGRS